MPSLFEDLANELIWMVFDYLSLCDLLHSFDHLNNRLSSLIRSKENLHLDFSARVLSKKEFVEILQELRSLSVVSIRLSNRDYVGAMSAFTSHVILSQLHHLRSLTLIDIDRNQMERCLQHPSQITHLSLKTFSVPSLPRHLLQNLSQMTQLHVASWDIAHGCYPNLTHLTLDYCSSEVLTQLQSSLPNLQSLSLSLTDNSNIAQVHAMPTHLRSLRLTLRSVLFDHFEHLLQLIDQLESLKVSMTTSEYHVYSFDQYLSGERWLSISRKVTDLQINIIINRSELTLPPDELLQSFDWCQRRIHCQSIPETDGYHLFTLPYIGSTYVLSSLSSFYDRCQCKDFDQVQFLHLISCDTDPNHPVHSKLPTAFRRLRKLRLMSSDFNDAAWNFLNQLMLNNSSLQSIQLKMMTKNDRNPEFLQRFLASLPPSIDTLILDRTSTIVLIELLDKANFSLGGIKRLQCSVKKREQFSYLLLFLLELLDQQRLIHLTIDVEEQYQSTNLLAGWALQNRCIRRARTASSERQCTIWV